MWDILRLQNRKNCIFGVGIDAVRVSYFLDEHNINYSFYVQSKAVVNHFLGKRVYSVSDISDDFF